MASSSSDSALSMTTLLHMLTIRLSSSNYLLWRNQMIPLFSYQNLLPHIDGSLPIPQPEIVTDGKSSSNPAYSAWLAADQRAIIILHASLTEEVVAEIIGLTTTRPIWLALEAAYSNSSVEGVQNLRDQLRQSTKGSSSVADFGRKFKSFCDQLAAIGHPVDDTDKLHWFLCGLGPSFEGFSTAVRTSRPAPSFRDLLAQAESHELFLRSLNGSTTAPTAFTAEQSNRPSSISGRPNSKFNRGNNNGGQGRGRRPPHCQLCRTNGHFANRSC